MRREKWEYMRVVLLLLGDMVQKMLEETLSESSALLKICNVFSG
jgi:hypothetical protein